MKKILICGCGGVGSNTIKFIADSVRQEQIDLETHFFIADNDLIEEKNLKYQNFTIDDLGENKAEVLAKRYRDEMVVNPLNKRIETEKDLEGYDLILSCVDNMETRKLIFEFCHKNNKDYLDFRSEGRMVMAFQKTNLKDDLETLDVTDKNSGSCQREYDTERAIIQKSYLISSAIAIQMLLNYLRGEKNYKILMRI